MFTGIVEELGRITAFTRLTTGARLTVAAQLVLADATPGASVNVNGVCLTAVELGAGHFSADLAPETLQRTNLGELTPGSPVNLERPLAANGRLHGHFVLGHVDGTAGLLSSELLGGEHWWVRVRLPRELLRYVVTKGSLALDGISLTVARLEDELASFAVIPHTWEHTTLHSYRPGARLNVEADVLAKHVEKLVAR